MRKTLALSVVLALAACGKKEKQSVPAGDCTVSVDNAINLSKEEFKKSNIPDATVPNIREASITRCKEDKWSNEVLKCFVDAKSNEEVTKCQNKMTKEQNDNIAKAITAAMAQDQGSGSETPPPPDNGSAGSGSAGSGSAGSGGAAAAGEMPKDCADYKAMLDKVVACDKLPQPTRDAMKKSYDTMSKSFATIKTMPADQQKTIADGCKTAADAMKKAVGDQCAL